MFENNSFINYRIFCIDKKLKNYFDLLPRPLWYLMIKFRCVNIKIPVVAGRYNSVPLDERICCLCNTNSIGDEFHCLFQCSYFDDPRKVYIKKYFYKIPNVQKMNELMNSTQKSIVLSLSKFVKIICSQFR